jgi:hypothetical protein
MSPAAARALSASLTLITLVAIGLGVTRLPGGRGPVDELVWLLRSPDASPGAFRRASRLLCAAEEKSPGATADLLAQALRTDNEYAVHNALHLLATDFPLSSALADAALVRMYDLWFRQQSLATKVRHLPYTLLCADPFPELGAKAGPRARPERRAWNVRLTARDVPWLVAATLERGTARFAAFRALFGPDHHFIREPHVTGRLGVLDGMIPREHKQLPETFQAFTPDALQSQLTIGVDELLDMLESPVGPVRWAAGRIFVVAGDRRGLAAFCDWLATHPRAPGAEDLLADLFGPQWRAYCESRRATGKPGERHGR